MADKGQSKVSKLNNQNYQTWKFKMELLLTKEDLWETIVKEAPDPVTAEWQTKDGKARPTMGLLVEDNQLHLIRKETTAKGAFGQFLAQSPQNKAVLYGATHTFTCAETAVSGDDLRWIFFPIGANDHMVISVDRNTHNLAAYSKAEGNANKLTIESANVSAAGVYKCNAVNAKAFVQFIVIAEGPVCKVEPNANKNRPCDKILQLSCIIKYSANESYVVPKMIWSTDDSSESLNSSIETSTSEKIATATSTLSVSRGENSATIPIYKCTAKFSLTNNLPRDFVRDDPDYAGVCKPFSSPKDVACEAEAGKSVETGKSGEAGKSDEGSGASSGFSVGLSERYNFIKRFVGIAGALLIGAYKVV